MATSTPAYRHGRSPRGHSPTRPLQRPRRRGYGDRMTASADAVAKAILDRRPTDSAAVLQHLLYLCQGRHLGWFGVPLFADPIHATDRGPEVAGLEPAADTIGMGNRELNTVGWVLAHYGNLPLRDLGTLIRVQAPYQLADVGRQPGQAATIDVEVLRKHFAAVNAAERAEMGISEEVIAAHLAGAKERLQEPAQVDDLDALRARVVDHAR